MNIEKRFLSATTTLFNLTMAEAEAVPPANEVEEDEVDLAAADFSLLFTNKSRCVLALVRPNSSSHISPCSSETRQTC
jgi:hypothetical protein